MEVRGVGALGEVRAEQYLQAQGYEILGRNYRCPGAEIDLIARGSAPTYTLSERLQKLAENWLTWRKF